MSSSAITGPILADNKRAPSGTAAAPSFAFNDSTGTGVYLVSPGVLGLSTAGVQRVVVDASGNVGIGTASPAYPFHTMTSATGTTVASNIVARFSSNGTGRDAAIQLSDSVTHSAVIGMFSGAMYFTSGGSTERMRLDASGNLLVGTTSVQSPANALTLLRSSVRWGVGPTDGSGNFIIKNDSSVGVYVSNGGNSWLAYSDERLKKNIKPLELGLEQIKALKPARFDYKTDESENSSRVGFIAQEVLPVLPHAVDAPEDAEQMMGVSATEMIPVLVKAIQELEARLAALESK